MMNIEAKDLRIGNWIFNDDGVPSRVAGFKPFDHSIRCDEQEGCEIVIDIFAPDKTERLGYLCESVEVTPIPLTPELLEKCGFSNHARSVSFGDSGFDPIHFWYIQDGVDSFQQKVFLYSFILGQFRDGFYYQANNRRKKGIKITSVHQLQNLWYSLTGNELEITL